MKRKFIIEIGMGVDLHGEDITKAAIKAVHNATSKQCLAGLFEICNADSNNIYVDILVGTTEPGNVDCAKVAKAIIFPQCKVKAQIGGLVVEGMLKNDGTRDTIQVVVAAVTVSLHE